MQDLLIIDMPKLGMLCFRWIQLVEPICCLKKIIVYLQPNTQHVYLEATPTEFSEAKCSNIENIY